MSMHKRKKPILPEQEFPEKKSILIGIGIGVSLGLLLGVTCGSLLCRSLPLGICIGGAAGFCLGLAVGTAFQKNNRKSEHRTKLLNLLCAVLFYLVR